jgi:hypothetical protein
MLVESSLFSRDLSQKSLQIEKRAGLVTDLRAKSAAKGLILEIDLFANSSVTRPNPTASKNRPYRTCP